MYVRLGVALAHAVPGLYSLPSYVTLGAAKRQRNK
jgi:hypothetical protein